MKYSPAHSLPICLYLEIILYGASLNSEGYVDSDCISINVRSEITLQNGEQYTLPIDNSDHTFKSHNDDVAIVSKNGVITAIGEGSAKMTGSMFLIYV